MEQQAAQAQPAAAAGGETKGEDAAAGQQQAASSAATATATATADTSQKDSSAASKSSSDSDNPCCICGKPATMICPTCKKKGLPPSYFCDQTCFKANWKVHKVVHKQAAAAGGASAGAAGAGTPVRRLPAWIRDYSFSGPLRPGHISAQRTVPDSLGIAKPDYAETSVPESEFAAKRGGRSVDCKTPEEIDRLRKACRIGREVIDAAGKAVKVGVTGDELDRIVHEACLERKAYPSPLNYMRFPKSVCVSANEVICHGIPDDRPLEDGDIVNLDVTVYIHGMHADLNETFFVGNVSADSVKLVRTAYECLRAAVNEGVKPGCMYRDLGGIITKVARPAGCSVVKTYCGHGIGELFHTSPNVPHYNKNKAVGVMKPGHSFTIEPMINLGTWKDVSWDDDWTAVTRDGQRSAQFEHTMIVTETGVEILTAREGWPTDHLPEFDESVWRR